MIYGSHNLEENTYSFFYSKTRNKGDSSTDLEVLRIEKPHSITGWKDDLGFYGSNDIVSYDKAGLPINIETEDSKITVYINSEKAYEVESYDIPLKAKITLYKEPTPYFFKTPSCQQAKKAGVQYEDIVQKPLFRKIVNGLSVLATIASDIGFKILENIEEGSAPKLISKDNKNKNPDTSLQNIHL